mmetsp:Transcript_34707/g.53237  ORF Transcript_34707/g.53237 Transcript_34707/m.53237 type:complete len:109 (+) Transcript_34707:1743-2069(+)|eukprot:CAMPEP_0170495246 /NCGR_PEP_ID=MMETSP0208-20121228/15095_1 /TAXON_ID=197538 /ORGANISM="Strombidium inclinatum, Strain S3" /LENGTH=108 /DNA_ID=CAMNT_0010771407 /DNA_START=1746 /DNA_END=2072 /DNA_ORIENTATION=+
MPEDLMWKLNEKQVFEFMKDFDIFPSLLSKSVAFKIFNHSRESEEIYKPAGLDILSLIQPTSHYPANESLANENLRKAGKFFTFFKFLDLLMKSAKMMFCGYSTGSES